MFITYGTKGHDWYKQLNLRCPMHACYLPVVDSNYCTFSYIFYTRYFINCLAGGVSIYFNFMLDIIKNKSYLIKRTKTRSYSNQIQDHPHGEGHTD